VIEAALAKLKLALQYTDKDGKVVEETPFVFDSANKRFVAKIGPLTVETYDADGHFYDSDQYPIPWGIKVKPFPIKVETDPTKTKGT
jgi:hypothetical protein